MAVCLTAEVQTVVRSVLTDTKKPPEGGFFVGAKQITLRRWLHQQVLEQQVPKRLLRELERQEPVLVQESQQRELVQALLLSYRKRREQQQQRWRPERETCSYREILDE
jgi:hypothetical protein